LISTLPVFILPQADVAKANLKAVKNGHIGSVRSLAFNV